MLQASGLVGSAVGLLARRLLPDRHPAMNRPPETENSSLGQSVLIIDDDPGTLHTFARALTRMCQCRTETAQSGRAGLELARSMPFDLVVVDLRLPDISGMSVLETLIKDRRVGQSVLVSAYLDISTTVQAMKLGAFTVLEKPVDVEQLLATARSALDLPRRARAQNVTTATLPTEPGSAAERWAHHVLKACESKADLKTLYKWAKFVGLSYTSLCESCRLVGIRPHDARDFARSLRVVLLSDALDCPADLLLDAADHRTRDALCRRAGFKNVGQRLSVPEFLQSQDFIRRDNRALGLLRELLQSAERG